MHFDVEPLCRLSWPGGTVSRAGPSVPQRRRGRAPVLREHRYSESGESGLNVLLFVLRIIVFTVWVLLGLLCIAIVYPFASAALRAGITRRWSRVLLVLCGVKTRVMGRPGAGGAALWVANHVSWVDVFVLNSVRGVSFISKDDVRKWPVIGWLVAGAGTAFLARGRRHAVRDAAEQMSLRFARGEVVGL